MQNPAARPNAPRRMAATTAAGGDGLSRQPIPPRIIQPTSTLDSLRVLNENVSAEVICAIVACLSNLIQLQMYPLSLTFGKYE